MKKGYWVVLATLVAVAATVLLGAGSATANPPGVSPGKKLWSFNIIATPKDWVEDDSVCSNNGARIFFQLGNEPWTVIWNFDPTVNNFNIVDCDGTSDKQGVVEQDAGVPADIYIRVLGKNTAQLGFVCSVTIPDPDNVNNTLCLVASTNLSKNKSFLKVSSHLFSDELSQITWTLDPNTDFRIAQVRVYQPSA